jgi:hypothetical protein
MTLKLIPSGALLQPRSPKGPFAENTAKKQRITPHRAQGAGRQPEAIVPDCPFASQPLVVLKARTTLERKHFSKCFRDDSTTNHFAMPKVLTVAARDSFNAVLREYKKSPVSGLNDRAHLQRWIDDDRAEQVWDGIRSAVHSNNLWLPPKIFIIDILVYP